MNFLFCLSYTFRFNLVATFMTFSGLFLGCALDVEF